MIETTLVLIPLPWVNKTAHVKLCEPYLKTGVLAIGLTEKPKSSDKGHGNAVLHLITYKKSVETMGDECSPVGWVLSHSKRTAYLLIRRNSPVA